MFSASKSGQYGGYQISRSVRLRSSASAYLNRTPAAAGSRTTWTWSGWVKKAQINPSQQPILFSASAGSSTCQIIYQISSFGTADAISIYDGNISMNLTTTAQYRDPSAWYHVVVAVDTTQATAANRVKLYVNGTQVTSFGTATYPAQNAQTGINNTVTHGLGTQYSNGSLGGNYFDGYLTEINFIDGQALTPSSFGQYNAYGVWSPLKYNGTYGTNGFYLNFSSNATAAALGTDFSGNSNTWTVNNISVTAGVTYDSMIDTPTPYADGGNGRGNYATLNPIFPFTSPAGTFSNGNLTLTGPNVTYWYTGLSSIPMSSGKWYCEATITSNTSNNNQFGVCLASSNVSDFASISTGYGYLGVNGNKKNNNSTAAYGATLAQGDVVGIAFDADNGTLTFYKNGTSQGTAFTGIPANTYVFAISCNPNTLDANFGQRPFSYTPPTGFKALNTFNLPAVTINNGATVMAATTYTGTGASLTVSNGNNNTTGVTFKPDLVWIKSRSAATDHKLTDSVRGTTKALISDTTGAETTDANGLTAFGTTGFTVGTDTNYNNNTATYVAWQWQAGQGTTSSNTSGSITSTVSVNATAGFSVVTFTMASGNNTVGHGLGVAPKLIILKERNVVTSWLAFHSSVCTTTSQYLALNTTAALATFANTWGTALPASSVFSVTSGATATTGNTVVAYCWAEIAGFSKFGSYTGNGSTDGPFVFLGFRPRFVLIKETDTTGGWQILDSGRSTYNVNNLSLSPNAANAEATTAYYQDFLSNGFKIRDNGAGQNTNGGTYIYAAFAENPFKYSLAR